MVYSHQGQNTAERMNSRARAAVREAVGFAARFSGFCYAVREILRRNRVLILVYHDCDSCIFRSHLNYFSSRYNFIGLNRLVDALERDSWGELPDKALVVTFDDGHRGNAELLEQFLGCGVSPTVYLCSDIAGTSHGFWWLSGDIDCEGVKSLPYGDFLRRLRDETGYAPDRAYEERQSLDIDELKRMNGNVIFGSHTKTHPILPRCPQDICAEEIADSRIALERMLGKDITHFAYPDGQYTERERKLVIDSGYRSARSLRFGWNGPRTDRFALRAICVDDDASLNVLCGQVSGVLPLLGRVLGKNRRRRACP